jgi:hypothetical protein
MDTSTCRLTCTAETAYLATQHFPTPYDLTDTCYWTIEGTFGQYVSLDVLYIDVQDDDPSCPKTYIAIYDVTLDNTPMQAERYCKSKRPIGPLRSSWHRMHVEFRAGDVLGTPTGFMAKYSLVTFYTDTINTTTSGKTCFVTQIATITMLTSSQKCISNLIAKRH